MLIKAGCSNNQSYVDRFSSSFVRVIQRLAREHHSSSNVETIGRFWRSFQKIFKLVDNMYSTFRLEKNDFFFF